ncbi:MAG: hypothetical protein AAF965_06430 [Pseudomonadota bacterium]
MSPPDDDIVSTQTERERLKLRRPTVSDRDGTREGGLVFPIIFILGFIAASLVHPGALSSFWVWFVLLMLSAAIAVGTQQAVARWNGFREDEES